MLRKCNLSITRLLYSMYLKKKFYFAAALKLTDSCNLQCSYCLSYEMNNILEMDSLLPFLEKYYRKGMRYVVLTGGEPFLYPNIEELYDYLLGKGFYISVNTNGQLIEDPIYRKLLLSSDEVAVSLDGKRSINDSNRGEGSFDKIIKTIEFLRKHNKKTRLSTVLTSESISDEFFDFFANIKKRYNVYLNFGILSNTGFADSGNVEKMLLDKKQVEKTMKLLVKYKRKYRWKEINNYLIEDFYRKKSLKCFSFNHFMYVNSDGNIYPCDSTVGNKKYCIGSLDMGISVRKNSMMCSHCRCQELFVFNYLYEKKHDFSSMIRFL